LLSEELKGTIRSAYTSIMDSKSLTPRWGQRQMIAEIANTLARIPGPGEPAGDLPAVCVVEAGTGTGKTIAYTVAAIPMAQALGKRLVVATATIALQEQFVNKDLPDIKRHSELDFSYALAKGRRRYICLSKLDRVLSQSEGDTGFLPLYPEEQANSVVDAIPVYNAMLDSLARGEWDGDRDNWSDNVVDEVWSGVTTDHSQCSGRRCPNISQCSFFRAREELQSADIIVTNHDLTLADLALGGGAILPEPEDCIYIFDEGHHLPDKALSHFASFCRLHTTVAWLNESAKVLTSGVPVLSNLAALRSSVKKLPAEMEEAAANLQMAEQVVANLFEGVEIDERKDDQQLRFDHGLVPETLLPVAAALAGQFGKLSSALSRMESVLEEALDDDFSGLDKVDIETWHLAVGAMVGRAEATEALWRDFAAGSEREHPPRARWITQLGGGGGQFGFELRCSPILAADILQEYLWSRAAGVIITSATITALNSFDRFMLHSGSPSDAAYKMVPSPFNYASARFVVPALPCDPGDAEGHTQSLVEKFPTLINAGEGTLVLFSSRRQMQDVYHGLPQSLTERILLQGDYSKQETLRRHREAIDEGEGSIVFGLASFAEGVDLPGDYCRHVIIAKIPFAVPNSPLEAALAEWVEAQGRNPFMEISVPDAALRLVQASGRLLRTEQDSGTVTLMDRRVVTRRYGKAILDSLPPFQLDLQR
jgi:ATP-dependent DNA helicase DinG